MSDSACCATLRQWLQQGPFGLTLSSGFFSFFAHCGLVTALSEAGLRPAFVSGSSAGALVGGAWAAGVSPAEIRQALFALRRQDFWDPAPGLGLLRGARFRALLDDLLPARTFHRCRIPLAVSVTDVLSWRPRAVTQGLLAPAVQASCTVPGLFRPVMCNGRWSVDGGVLDRPGILGMPRELPVLFHNIVQRSPWRRPHSPALAFPQRPNLYSVAVQGLPRVGPFHLPRGPHAFFQAYRAAQRALDTPLDQPVIYV